MKEIAGRDILNEVKKRCEPFQKDFLGKKITILRFAPSPQETNAIALAKYEAARYSTDHKVKTFKFIGCEVDTQLLHDKTTIQEFEAILSLANVDLNTAGIIVQNPIPKKMNNSLSLISPKLDLDAIQENHSLFRASATSETISRLVKSFADEKTKVAVVGAKEFVGCGVIRLLEQDNIQCIGLDEGDDLLRTREADIVVSATGVPELLDERHLVPKHQLVVDAGFVPIFEQQILGDVKRSAYGIPQNLTPVPGGVGPLQMATLLERLVTVATGRAIEKWTYRGASHLPSQEAVETALAVRHLLRTFGETQLDGSVTFDSTNWRFAQYGEIVTITVKQDNREILRVDGDRPVIFNLTPLERAKLKDFRQYIASLEKQQQQRRTQEPSL